MKARILLPSSETIASVAQVLREDQVVAIPTETVYGLAGIAHSPLALTRIFEAKERPHFDPLIIHVSRQVKSVSDLEDLDWVDGSQISPSMRKCYDSLIQKFWPGPLTLIFPKTPAVPDLATSGLPTVAIRMPSHPIAQAVIEACGSPLAAPSANRFGRISPTCAQAVFEELGDRIEWILDGGPCLVGLESTIVALTEDDGARARILRPGGVPQNAIEEVLGRPLELTVHFNISANISTNISDSSSSPIVTPILSPGMLASHYAPSQPFHLLPKKVPDLTRDDLSPILHLLEKIPAEAPIGLLFTSGNATLLSEQFKKLIGKTRTVIGRSLTEKNDLGEAARNLFAEMRALDSILQNQGTPTRSRSLIFSEPCSVNHGLGYAINDRLKRASAQRENESNHQPLRNGV